MSWKLADFPNRERPVERHWGKTGEAQRGMRNESVRKYLVILFGPVGDLAAVSEALGANAFGTILLVRFFPCGRWILFLDCRFGNMTARLRVGGS